MISVRKLKVYCEDKTFYNYIRNEQREQNKALNYAINLKHMGYVLKNIDSGVEERIKKNIEKNKKAKEKLEKKLESKITDKKREEIKVELLERERVIKREEELLEEGREYRKGIDREFTELYINHNNMYQVIAKHTNCDYMRTLDLAKQKVEKDYSNKFVDILTGKISLPNYKQDVPLMIDKKNIKIYEEEGTYKIGIMRGYELVVVLGKSKRENVEELKKTLEKIIKGEYKVVQSSMGFDKKNRVIFNLGIDIPDNKESYKPIEGRVLGVDLGIKYPVYMSVSDTPYKRKSLGSINDFLKVRTQMQSRRRQLQKTLSLTKGGKGRKRKLKTLESLKEKERNFVKTYNHAMSKRVVDFAKSNKCEYIHIENLTKEGFNDRLLRNWSYYELQSMIGYKASREGIKVRKVNPAYTSQKCSKCGHISRDNRVTQEEFKCVECGYSINADWNASINIAKSSEIVK